MSGVFSTILSLILLLNLYFFRSKNQHGQLTNSSNNTPQTAFTLMQNESMVKAAFIYQFTQYVNLNKKNFNIAVLGNSNITPTLEEISKRKGNIKVKEYSDLAQVSSCDILFLPKNSPVSLASVLSKFGSKPVLIVSEQSGYGKKGAHINFVVNKNKVTFEANLKTAKKSGLTISSELLKHATIVAQ